MSPEAEDRVSRAAGSGPHRHYEVRVHNVPVNPHKYLRTTYEQVGPLAAPATPLRRQNKQYLPTGIGSRGTGADAVFAGGVLQRRPAHLPV